MAADRLLVRIGRQLDRLRTLARLVLPVNAPLMASTVVPAHTVAFADCPAPPDLAAWLLGGFTVTQRGVTVDDWHGTKPQTVLKYLLAHPDRPVIRDVLMELLWPGIDPTAGRRNLHQVIYSLRQALRQHDPDTSYILFRNDCYLLNPALRIWCDVTELDRCIADARRCDRTGDINGAIAAYRRAEGLYGGDFLPENLYDEWTFSERERLRSTWHEASDRLGELLSNQRRWDEVIETAQRLVALDPLAEAAHRRIMLAYRAKGQRNLAIRQYRICAAALKRDLALAPSPETDELYRLIRS